MLPPLEITYYNPWQKLDKKRFYEYAEIPEMLRYGLHKGKSVTFYIEENITTGYLWFARYDANLVSVEIEHQDAKFTEPGFVGRPGRARIKVTAKYDCETLIEFIHARPWEWEKDVPPAKVVQLFIYRD